MIKNYLKIAWRNLVKSKGYSAINIGGLAVGMAVAMLIGMWIWDEMSFDKYHQNYDHIAQVMQNNTNNGTVETTVTNPTLMAAEIREKYGSSFKYAVQASWQDTYVLSYGDKHLAKEGIYFEPDAPAMLGLKMIRGTHAGLTEPYSILLSESVAKSLFGVEDPLDKSLKINQSFDVKVTGVYEDLPYNTTLKSLKVIMPFSLWLKNNPWITKMDKPWASNFSLAYVQIADNVSIEEASQRIKNIKADKLSKEDAKFKWEVFLHPMSKWQLYKEFKNGVNIGGQIKYVWMFGIIGAFVLILACINFMNLTTARSGKKAREVGIRKALGSVRSQLVNQFFIESYLVVFVAFLLSLLLVIVLLPFFNEVADKKIEILWTNPLFWSITLLFIAITGLLAGSYPAFYLSSFQPLKVLKGTFRVGKWAAMPRKALVVVQFTVSIILIIGTIVVYQQIKHAQNRPIGYDRNNLIGMSLDKGLRKHLEAFRADLKTAGLIEELAASNSPLTNVWTSSDHLDWEGKDPGMAVDFPNSNVTVEWGKTIGWNILKGRDFSKDFAGDSSSFIINESLAKFLGFNIPIGKTIKWGDKPYTIIGIVSDIISESPFAPVRPSLYHIGEPNLHTLTIKLNPNKSAGKSIAQIENIWKKYVPNSPFSYEFIDQQYSNKFSLEERIGKLAAYFSLLAILISCLGLFGITSFVAEQRTKEIGIRKVLGASVVNLWQMLSKDFIVLVIVSCFIAIPIAYYYMNEWLQKYEYRTNMTWWIFATAAFGALVITLLTVSFQAIKAAIANPVKSLRAE